MIFRLNKKYCSIILILIIRIIILISDTQAFNGQYIFISSAK